MRRTLSLAHLTVLDTTPPELISAAAEAGFDHVGLRLCATPGVGTPPYQADILRDSPLRRETLARLRDLGVSVLDAEFLRFEPDAAEAVPEGFLETSALLGAREVLVMSMEPEERRTAERLAELCERARAYGLRVNLEFAAYTGVRSLSRAQEVVAGTDAGVLVDVVHFARSGGQPSDLQGVDPARLRYAQLCDVAAETPTTDAERIREARTGRLLPGDGVFPLGDLLAALPHDLPLSVEAPVRALAGLPAAERARRARAALLARLTPARR